MLTDVPGLRSKDESPARWKPVSLSVFQVTLESFRKGRWSDGGEEECRHFERAWTFSGTSSDGVLGQRISEVSFLQTL